MKQSDPLLLLDNSALAYILVNGDYRFTTLKFEEARAIIDMYAAEDVVKTFDNLELEKTVTEYLEISNQHYPYVPVDQMKIGQDAIAFKVYITPSGTQPIVLGNEGQEAKKIKNIYIYCQHIVRLK